MYYVLCLYYIKHKQMDTFNNINVRKTYYNGIDMNARIPCFIRFGFQIQVQFIYVNMYKNRKIIHIAEIYRYIIHIQKLSIFIYGKKQVLKQNFSFSMNVHCTFYRVFYTTTILYATNCICCFTCNSGLFFDFRYFLCPFLYKQYITLCIPFDNTHCV